MKDKRKKLLDEIPDKPQRQDSTRDQLLDLLAVGNKLGMHDAADLIKDAILNERQN